MDLEVRWLQPFLLRDGTAEDLIYEVVDRDHVPQGPGVYAFARMHGRSLSPLYIGKALNLSRRIEQQLNRVRLMRGIENAPIGQRVLCVGELITKPGQKASTALGIIESALISAAMLDGFELLNIKGTKTPVHHITSTGNREGRRWLKGNYLTVEQR